jgi:DNA-binding CsgD family transcriptional regulator
MWGSAGSRQRGLSEADALFRGGELEKALARLASEPLSPARVAFEAHVLYWRRRNDEASSFVRSSLRAFSRWTCIPDLVLARSIECAALASMGRTHDAEQLLEVIDAESIETHLSNECRFYCALANWSLRRYEKAAMLLRGISDPNEILAGYKRHLEGWLRAAKGDLEGQVEATLHVLELNERSRTRDVTLDAMALRVLAALAHDMLDGKALSRVLSSPVPAWPSDLDVDRFHIVRTRAWAMAMRGDYIGAGEEMSAARRLAATPYMHMMAHLDRAWLALISNERLHAEIELRDAEVYAYDIGETPNSNEEVEGLLCAVELMSHIDQTRSRALMERAGAIPLLDSSGFARDQRLRAFRLSAQSALDLAVGRRREATSNASEAFIIFENAGYLWHSTNLALRLHSITGKSTWLNAVEGVALAYPRSFIAAEHERLSTIGRTPFEVLTKRQREVVELIRNEGLDNDTIAARLRMSPNTVRIHKRKIYKTFGVSNEYELLARLSREAS